jgi:hypothetical protein
METIQQYVIRKLKEPYINVNGVGSHLRISRSTLYRVINGGETGITIMQRLNDFFRHINE